MDFEIDVDSKSPFRRPSTKAIGIACFLIPPAILTTYFVTDSDTWLVLTWVAGIPLVLLGSSLLFGRGRNEKKGVMSPITLFLCAGLAGVISAMSILSNNYIGAMLFAIVTFTIFSLGYERTKHNEDET
jgi:hypothetical protein